MTDAYTQVGSLTHNGGFGFHYSGTEVATGKPVSINKINFQHVQNPALRARRSTLLTQDLERCRPLRHLNVVSILHYAVDAFGHFDVVNEHFVSGLDTLTARINDFAYIVEGRGTAAFVATFAQQAAKGLEYLHGRGLYHGRLTNKSSVVMVETEAGPVFKLADVYVREIMDQEAQEPHCFFDLPPAPEILVALANRLGFDTSNAPAFPVGPHSDIHALGGLVYYICGALLSFEANVSRLDEALQRLRTYSIETSVIKFRSLGGVDALDKVLVKDAYATPLVAAILVRMITYNPEGRPTASDVVRAFKPLMTPPSDFHIAGVPVNVVLARAVEETDAQVIERAENAIGMASLVLSRKEDGNWTALSRSAENHVAPLPRTRSVVGGVQQIQPIYLFPLGETFDIINGTDIKALSASTVGDSLREQTQKLAQERQYLLRDMEAFQLLARCGKDVRDMLEACAAAGATNMERDDSKMADAVKAMLAQASISDADGLRECLTLIEKLKAVHAEFTAEQHAIGVQSADLHSRPSQVSLPDGMSFQDVMAMLAQAGARIDELQEEYARRKQEAGDTEEAKAALQQDLAVLRQRQQDIIQPQLETLTSIRDQYRSETNGGLADVHSMAQGITQALRTLNQPVPEGESPENLRLNRRLMHVRSLVHQLNELRRQLQRLFKHLLEQDAYTEPSTARPKLTSSLSVNVEVAQLAAAKPAVEDAPCDTHTHVTELHEELELYRRRALDTETRMAELQAVLDNVERERADMSREMTSIKATSELLAGESEGWRQEFERLRAAANNMEATLADLRASTDVRAQTLEAERTALETQLAEVKRDRDRLKACAEEVAQHSAPQEQPQLQHELEACHSDLQRLQQRCRELEANRDSALEQLKARDRELANACADGQRLREEASAARLELGNVQQTAEHFRLALEERNVEVQELPALRREVERLQGERTALQGAIEERGRYVQSMTLEIGELESAARHYEQALQDAEDAKSSLQREVNEHKHVIGIHLARVEELEAMLQTAAVNNATTCTQLQDRIAALEAELAHHESGGSAGASVGSDQQLLVQIEGVPRAGNNVILVRGQSEPFWRMLGNEQFHASRESLVALELFRHAPFAVVSVIMEPLQTGSMMVAQLYPAIS